MPDWYWHLTDAVFVMTYHILAPLNFIFGLGGHFIFLYVCYREKNKEKAYCYQILLIISEILELITGGLYNFITAFYGLAGAERKGAAADWISSKYFIIWYYAVLSSPLMSIFVNLCLLLSTCIAMDRVLALAKPYSYKSYNHTIHQIVAFCISLLLSIFSNVIDCFRKTAGQVAPGVYHVANNALTIDNSIVDNFHQLRNLVPGIGLVILLVCNVVIIYMYRARKVKVGTMTTTNPAREAARKENEKTLLILTAFQSVFSFFTVVFNISYRLLFYFLPSFATCGSYLMVPIQHCGYLITYGFDFYIMLLVSKRFRKLLKNGARKHDTNAMGMGGERSRSIM